MPGKSIEDVFVKQVIAKLVTETKEHGTVKLAKKYDCNAATICNIMHGRCRPSLTLACTILETSVEKLNTNLNTPSSKLAKLRNPPRLPTGNVSSSGARSEPVVERGGGVLRLQRPGRQQHAVLPEVYAATEEPKVTLLGKTKVRELDTQNHTRALNGLPQLVVRVYTCLKCRLRFESVSNRLCTGCRNVEVTVLSGVEIFI